MSGEQAEDPARVTIVYLNGKGRLCTAVHMVPRAVLDEVVTRLAEEAL